MTGEASISSSRIPAGGSGPIFCRYVFERFRQEDATATREYGGLGLGLAIARELAALHNGKVQAFSDGAGQGATFVLKLPLMGGSR